MATLERGLSPEELGDLASIIPGSRIKQIARNNLNMDPDVIDLLYNEARGNNWKFIYELLGRYGQDKDNPRQVSMFFIYAVSGIQNALQPNMVPNTFLAHC